MVYRRIQLIMFLCYIISVSNIFGFGSTDFEVLNLQVTPDSLTLGDSCVATVDLSNLGDEDGSYSLNLTVKRLPFVETDDYMVIQQVMMVEAGKTINVSFFFTPEESGSYDVSVDNESKLISIVEEPERPRVTNVVPSSGRQGDLIKTRISGTRLTDVTSVEFSLGESVLEVLQVEQEDPESLTVQIKIPVDASPGPYDIKVTNSYGLATLSWAFIVQETAEYDIVKLDVNPGSVKSGEEVTVTVHVTNTSDVEGNQSVTVQVDGVDTESENVTLDPGETKQVQFNFSVSDPGDYTLTVGDEQQTIIVVEEQANETDSADKDSNHYPILVVALTCTILAILLVYMKIK